MNGLLDDNRARGTVRLLLERRPRGYMGILAHFHRLIKLDVARRSAKVETATPIAPEVRAAVQGNLARTYGAGVSAEFSENPSLIGGMRVQVGSDVYDGSVRARLAALQQGF